MTEDGVRDAALREVILELHDVLITRSKSRHGAATDLLEAPRFETLAIGAYREMDQVGVFIVVRRRGNNESAGEVFTYGLPTAYRVDGTDHANEWLEMILQELVEDIRTAGSEPRMLLPVRWG